MSAEEHDALIKDYLRTRSRSTEAALSDQLLAMSRAYVNKAYPVLSADEKHDIVHSVLVDKLLPKLHTYDSFKSQLSTWVCRVVRNSVLDYLRRKKNRGPLMTELAHEDGKTPDFEAAPSTDLLTSDDIADLNVALPLRIPTAALQELARIYVDSKGSIRTSAHIRAVTQVLAEHGVAWESQGEATEITGYLWGLFNQAKATDMLVNRIQVAIGRQSPLSTLSLLESTLGTAVAATVVLLAGGMTIPSAKNVLKRR